MGLDGVLGCGEGIFNISPAQALAPSRSVPSPAGSQAVPGAASPGQLLARPRRRWLAAPKGRECRERARRDRADGQLRESCSSSFICSVAQLDSKAISKADLSPRADTRFCSLAPCGVLQLCPAVPAILLHRRPPKQVL